MTTLLYLVAIAMLLGGIVLIITDFPFEAQFPWAGPALTGFGLMLNIALFYIGRRKL